MINIDNALIQATTEDIVYTLKAELAERGINIFHNVKPNGENVQTNCPFHKGGQERKPSFGINATKNKCHCFSCNWAGSIEEMISELFGYINDDGKYGKSWLQRRFNSVDIEHRNININFSRDKTTLNTDNYISEEELDSYRYYHPYMYERRLTDDIINLFDIGFDSGTDCITFPNRDIHGNCLFVARRSVKTKFFNYPREVAKPLYGLYELYTLTEFPKEIYVCESMLDATTVWVYGKYAVALNGLGTDKQFKALSNMPCRKIIIATDNDSRGLDARNRIRRSVKGKIITEIDPQSFPEGAKDINDLSKEQFDALKEIF